MKITCNFRTFNKMETLLFNLRYLTSLFIFSLGLLAPNTYIPITNHSKIKHEKSDKEEKSTFYQNVKVSMTIFNTIICAV